MKKIKLSILFTIMSMIIFAQTYHTVDNSPTSTADFKQVTEAIAAAKDGDIIIVQGSVTAYENFSVNKRLTIIGPGFFLGDNPEPYIHTSLATANVERFSIVEGGDYSHVSGFVVTKFYSPGNCNSTDCIFLLHKVSNAVVSNCYFKASLTAKESTGKIKRCYIRTVSTDALNYSQDVVLSLENNIFKSGMHYRPFAGSSTGNQSSMKYIENLFLMNTNSRFHLGNNSDTMTYLFERNIFLGEPMPINNPNTTPAIARNNIFAKNSEPAHAIYTSNGNIVNTNWQQMFVGNPNWDNFGRDGRWQLSENSVALNFAGGRNAGPFQQTGGYVLSGIPFIPNIYDLKVNETATAENGLTITIGAKANSK